MKQRPSVHRCSATAGRDEELNITGTPDSKSWREPAALGILLYGKRASGNTFKNSFDEQMAEVHDKDWAELFSEIVQQVVEDMLGGKPEAFSKFV